MARAKKHDYTLGKPTATPEDIDEAITAIVHEAAKPKTRSSPTDKDRPLKGRGGRGNFPNSKANYPDDEEGKAFRTNALKHLLYIYNLPKVNSDDELLDRINYYFEKCIQDGMIPTVEGMCLSTGYSEVTIHDWETGKNKGFSVNTSKLIKKAKDIIKSYDAQLVINGKMNPIPYIFRAKNYYGMSDKQEIQVSSNNGFDEQEMSAEDIAKRYLEGDTGTVETTFKEDD